MIPKTYVWVDMRYSVQKNAAKLTLFQGEQKTPFTIFCAPPQANQCKPGQKFFAPSRALEENISISLLGKDFRYCR